MAKQTQSKSPAFQFYPKDWLADAKVRLLSWPAKGVYIELLAVMWNEGKDRIKDDPDIIAPILQITKKFWIDKRAELQRPGDKVFSESRGYLISRRLRQERKKQQSRTDAARENALKKWPDDRDRRNQMTRSQRLAEARKKGRHTRSQWEKMAEYYDYTCLRCGDTESGVVRDHVTPIYQGGSDGLENIQPLCRKCNAAKGPENKDFRPDIEACLIACGMPAERLPNASSSSPSPSPSPSSEDNARVTWDGTAFYVPLDIMAEFQGRWPNIAHEAIDQEIRDCAAYHREHKSKVKAPRARIVTWLKKAFDKYQQQEVPVQKRPGQNLRAVLGLEDGAGKHGSDDTTES